jgi:choice-of-anchor C domain-containing protein
MRTFALLTSVAFLAVAMAAPIPTEVASPELIVNGGFEDGPEVEIYLPLDEKSDKLKGWTVTRGQIDYLGTHWKHAEGKRSLDLHGSPGFGGVRQTIKTEKGKTYRLSFQMAGNPGVATKLMTLEVCANKASKKFDFDCTDKTTEDMGWTKKTWDFKADSDETVIEIATVMKTEEFAGPALDDVSVKLLK